MDANMDLSGEILSEVSDALAYTAPEEKHEPVTCMIEHTLLPEHLADYADQHGNLQSAQKADEKDLVTLRARHHSVARLLAEGVPEGVVAQMCGYEASYVSTLKNTPAMVELISFYRGPKNETAAAIGEKLRRLGDMSIDLIEKKLEEEGTKASLTELAGVAKLGFDRSGHGPSSTVHNIEEHRIVGAEELLELNREARRRNAPRIVDVSAVRSVLPPPQEKQNDQPGTTVERVPDPDSAGDSDNPVP